MKKNLSDIGIIKTQPILFLPLKYTKYEVLTVLSKYNERPNTSISNEDRVSLQKHKDENESFYIAGVGPLLLDSELADFNSYEDVRGSHIEINDTKLLEDVLSVGFQLLDIKGNRLSCSDKTVDINLLVAFTEKYGLERENLSDTIPREEIDCIRRFGCRISSLMFRLQDIAIAYMRLTKLKNVRDNDEKCTLTNTASWVTSNIISRCVYSENENRFFNILIANALLDVANFQLAQVMANDVYTRKCENPTCSNVVIGGRSDRKTCSDACRKTIERMKDR